MELTEGVLRRFVGGQIKITNGRGIGSPYCGEIKAIRVEGEGARARLVVDLAWLARETGSSSAKRWVMDDRNEPHKANLTTHTVSDIGDGKIRLTSDVTSQMTVLYPKGSVVLDRSKVKLA